MTEVEVIERIAKLLALAEGASTTEEAESAFAKAQELATRHAIDLELARQSRAPKERETPTYRTIRIGEKGKRSNANLVRLFCRVGEAHDVDVLIATNSTWVEAYGMPSDIDAAEVLWNSLAVTMTKFGDRLVRDKSAPWRSEYVREWDHNRYEYSLKPVSGQGARASFYRAFTQRIGERLMEARRDTINTFDVEVRNEQADDSRVPSSMALVLKDKREEVEQYMYAEYKRRHGRKPGTWKGGGTKGTHSASASEAGRQAANRASLTAQKGISA